MNTFNPPLAVFVKFVVNASKKKPKTTMDPRKCIAIRESERYYEGCRGSPARETQFLCIDDDGKSEWVNMGNVVFDFDQEDS